MRKGVYGGRGAFTLGAVRQELARWRRGFREVSQVLFPEEVAGRGPGTPSGGVRPANRIAGGS